MASGSTVAITEAVCEAEKEESGGIDGECEETADDETITSSSG